MKIKSIKETILCQGEKFIDLTFDIEIVHLEDEDEFKFGLEMEYSFFGEELKKEPFSNKKDILEEIGLLIYRIEKLQKEFKEKDYKEFNKEAGKIILSFYEKIKEVELSIKKMWVY